VREAGADAILVGEALMRAPDPAVRIRELTT
jgi:indole-3-glycerol phosphate synthase